MLLKPFALLFSAVFGPRSVSTSDGKRVSNATVLTLFVVCILLPAFLIFALARARSEARKTSCQSNIGQIGNVFREFTADQSYFPELAAIPGVLMFRNESGGTPHLPPVYPEYLPEPRLLHCPGTDIDLPLGSDPVALINDHSYFYLGYAVMNDGQMQAFAEAYKQRLATGLPFDSDLDVAPGQGTGGGSKILRLRLEVEGNTSAGVVDDTGHLSRNIQSQIPILWDRNAHPPQLEGIASFFRMRSGITVLYLDGHREYKHFGEWPATVETMRILEELDSL